MDLTAPSVIRIRALDAAGQPAWTGRWATLPDAPESGAVMLRAQALGEPHRQTAMVAEGFCPRCAHELDPGPEVATCTSCKSGWSVTRCHTTLGWWVEVREYDEAGHCLGALGWRYPDTTRDHL